MVGPTKVNPLFFKSLLISSDSLLVDGISFQFLYLFTAVLYLTNCQMYLSNVPNSSFISRNFFALLTNDSTFFRFRIMPGSFRSESTSLSVYLEILLGLNLSNAFLYAGLLRSIVAHDSPACAPSSRRNSNSFLSSCSGTPHSASWYL